jgi:hypothetical protein
VAPEPAGTTAEPAETAAPETAAEAAGGGHTDEVAGATTESNVDHQFNGQE